MPLEPTVFGNKQKLPESADKCNDIGKKLSVISGSWLESVSFDEKEYWNVSDYTPQRQIHHIPLKAEKEDAPRERNDIVMPSDWRNREDLLWLLYGF